MIQRISTKGGRSAVLALLLASALLLCHGVYGAYHQVHHQTWTGAPHQHAPGHAPHEGHAAASGAHTAGHAEGQEGDCSGCVAYSTVLLVFFLGALIALWRGTRFRTSTTAPPPFPLGRVPAVLYAARGPTLPALQVFRL